MRKLLFLVLAVATTVSAQTTTRRATNLAALLAYLRIARADIMGYSLGGGVALRTARIPAVAGSLAGLADPHPDDHSDRPERHHRCPDAAPAGAAPAPMADTARVCGRKTAPGG